MRLQDIPGIDEMSVREKIALVEDLWDSIAADPSVIPVPDSHKTELGARAARHAMFPHEVLTLEELRRQIDDRKQ